jgi:hypothetical protein
VPPRRINEKIAPKRLNLMPIGTAPNKKKLYDFRRCFELFGDGSQADRVIR